MIEKKEIEKHKLKYYYDDRHGFVFKAEEKSSDTNIEGMCQLLKHKGVSDQLPEFYCYMDDRYIFVYPEGAKFLSGPFFQACHQLSRKFMFLVGGMDWEIDIFNAWIKEQD